MICVNFLFLILFMKHEVSFVIKKGKVECKEFMKSAKYKISEICY